MYRPLLSAGLSDRFEREIGKRPSWTHTNGRTAHTRSQSLASSSTSRLPMNNIDATTDDWESLSYNSSSQDTDVREMMADGVEGGHAAQEDVERESSIATANGSATDPQVGYSQYRRTALVPAPSQRSHAKPHLWISLWFIITIPVIFWDASYCFMRPRSMAGGDLHWIWKPYKLYQDIDYVYGLPSLERGDGFTNAQSLLNIIENCMNIAYLYLAHVVGTPIAPVVGFASITMTLSKTVLYWAQEFYCGGCSVGHNDFATLFFMWMVPNGLWLIFPSFIVYQLGKDIAASLHVAHNVVKKASSGKQL